MPGLFLSAAQVGLLADLQCAMEFAQYDYRSLAGEDVPA